MDLQERTTKELEPPSGASLFRPVSCSRWVKHRPIAVKCPQVSPKTGSKFLKEPQNPAKKGVNKAVDLVKNGLEALRSPLPTCNKVGTRHCPEGKPYPAGKRWIRISGKEKKGGEAGAKRASSSPPRSRGSTSGPGT